MLKKVAEIYNLNSTFIYFPKVENMRFFEYEKQDLINDGVLFETFFEFKKKHKKPFAQTIQGKTFFPESRKTLTKAPAFHDGRMARGFRHSRKFFEEVDSSGQIQRPIKIIGEPISEKNALNGMILHSRRHLDLGNLRISSTDLIKSPSFYFKVKLSSAFPKKFEILRVVDKEPGTFFQARILRVDEQNATAFKRDFGIIKRVFLDDAKNGYYDPKTFKEEEFKKAMKGDQVEATKAETPEETKTNDQSEETSKNEKSAETIEKEKKIVANYFYKLELKLQSKSGVLAEYLSPPILFPEKNSN